MEPELAAADMLEGLELPGDWTVLERVSRPSGASGGNFSVGYIVESSNGTRGFLKALDYRRALKSADPPTVLEAMTAAFIHERLVLQRCRDHGLTRVVSVLADGKIDVVGASEPRAVNYLVFELATADIRQYLDVSQQLDAALILRCLHHVATGLDQLHRHGMAHQDLKPSNVLIFDDGSSKVGDLGRSMYQGHFAAHNAEPVAGDYNYAPPECLYGQSVPGFEQALASDAYLLGSLAMFLFADATSTALMLAQLDPAHHWLAWHGPYEEILPFLRDAFDHAIELFSTSVHGELRHEVVAAVRQLCEPDPRFRGHPRNRVGLGSPYSLERYVSQFDLLSRRAELGLIRSLRA